MTVDINSPFWPRTALQTIRRYGGQVDENPDRTECLRFTVTFVGVRVGDKNVTVIGTGKTLEEAAHEALGQFVPRHYL